MAYEVKFRKQVTLVVVAAVISALVGALAYDAYRVGLGTLASKEVPISLGIIGSYLVCAFILDLRMFYGPGSSPPLALDGSTGNRASRLVGLVVGLSFFVWSLHSILK